MIWNPFILISCLDISQDDESVFGHVLIAFLSPYEYCKIESISKKAELNKNLNTSGFII